MKRLRFLAIISVLLFGVLGGFVMPENANAEDCSAIASEVKRNACFSFQASQGTSCSSISNEVQRDQCFSNILLEGGKKIFTDQISFLQTPTSSGKPSGVGFDFLIKSIQGSQQVFETYYQNNKSSGQTAAYKAGMLRARNYLNNQKTAVGRPNEFNQEPISNFVLQFTEVLLLESNRADDTFFVTQQTGKTPGDATSLVNAKISDAGGRTTSAASAVKKDVDNQKNPDACSISFTGSFSITGCIDQFIAWIITHTFLQLAGYLLWLTANMMNYVIKVGILDFAKWAPDTLYPIWIIVRQIISLMIVFAGLYLGLMYIINKDSDSKFGRYVPWVVVFALFVNFSYPLARTIVDVSNIVSLNVYASTVGSKVLTASVTDNTYSAGALIRNKLGLIGLVDYATGGSKDATLNDINSTPVALLAVAFIGYAAYIFFLVTALITMRTVVLIFIIVASPILLVDSVIPKLGEQAMKIRKMFFEQLMVGPVFMIMFALTLKFLDVFKLGGASSITANKGDATIAMFFNLLIMLVMLHIMLKVTKSTAGTMGEMATNFMGKVGGVGLGVATGGAGLLARGTIGRAAMAVRDSKWVTNNQNSMIGRAAHNMSNSVAASSFDLRNSTVVANRANKLGMGMGMGRKLGYEQALNAREKEASDGFKLSGTHVRNVYSPDGKTLLHAKGDIDTSAEGNQLREDYIKRKTSGVTSIFKSDQEKADTKYKLEEANKGAMRQAERNEKDKVVDEYNKFGDTPEEKAKKEEFFKKQTDEVKKKLEESDWRKVLAEYRNYEEDERGKADRDIFKSKQSAEVIKRLEELESKKETATSEKAAQKTFQNDTLDANKRVAAAQEEIARLMKTPPVRESTPAPSQGAQAVSTTGYEQTGSGIYIPSSPTSARPNSTPPEGASGEAAAPTPPKTPVPSSGKTSSEGAGIDHIDEDFMAAV